MNSLPPINPRREALAQAARALRDKKKSGWIRLRYEPYQDQIEEIENNFREIIEKIEEEIIQIDREEVKAKNLAALQTTCQHCGAKLFAPDPIHICRTKK